MRVSICKSEDSILCQKTVDCSIQVGSELLLQLKEYSYLGVLFTSKGKMECLTAKMSFHRRMARLILRDRVRSSDIWWELGIEPLLLRIERSQFMWFGHLIRMPPGRCPLEVFWARPTRRPWGRPRTCWRDYISHLAWECPRIPQEAPGKCCLGEGGSLTCCPRKPALDKRKKMDGWIDVSDDDWW